MKGARIAGLGWLDQFSGKGVGNMRTIHILGILVLLAFAEPAAPAYAGGVVTVCDEAHLLTALAGGGTVTFACSGTITLTSTIVISADTTIDGSGQSVTLSGDNAVRVIMVNPGAMLSLNTLTIANGRPQIPGEYGGGIFNYGTLTVSNTVFTGNSANGGGAIFSLDYEATLSVSNSTFSGNTATVGGGAISGSSIDNALTVSGSTFTNNTAGLGGGIYVYGVDGSMSATISNSTFSGNTATSRFGGGAIYSSSGGLILNGSVFSGNSGRVGGAIANFDDATLNASDSIFSNNSAFEGGGIHNAGSFSAGVVTINRCTFSGNTATSVGGGIVNFRGLSTGRDRSGRNPSESDGISSDGRLVVRSSTFSGNSAMSGGGVFNEAHAAVVNSTFSGNRASSSGGGIANEWREAALTVLNSTFSNNNASFGGGFSNAGALTLKNTIVANNPTGGNCAGSAAVGAGNLSYPDVTCPGINRNPRLGPLQDNGGPTETMALGPGSAAIDAADDAVCAADPVNNLDQRGVTRPQGARCDIGAVEHLLPFRKWLPAVRSR